MILDNELSEILLSFLNIFGNMLWTLYLSFTCIQMPINSSGENKWNTPDKKSRMERKDMGINGIYRMMMFPDI